MCTRMAQILAGWRADPRPRGGGSARGGQRLCCGWDSGDTQLRAWVPSAPAVSGGRSRSLGDRLVVGALLGKGVGGQLWLTTRRRRSSLVVDPAAALVVPVAALGGHRLCLASREPVTDNSMTPKPGSAPAVSQFRPSCALSG